VKALTVKNVCIKFCFVINTNTDPLITDFLCMYVDPFFKISVFVCQIVNVPEGQS
jgi:hypothetical protein